MKAGSGYGEQRGESEMEISIDWREARNVMVRRKEMSDVEEKS